MSQMNRNSFLIDPSSYVSQSIRKKYSYDSLFSPIGSPKMSPLKLAKTKISDYFKHKKQQPNLLKKKTIVSCIFAAKLPKLSNTLNVSQKKDLQGNRLFGIRRVLNQLKQKLERENASIKQIEMGILYELVQIDNIKEVWQKVRIFKADKKFLSFRSALSSLIFYNLTAAVCREFGMLQASIQSDRFCQFLALKNQWFELAMIYFWEQADSLMKINQHSEAVQKLKYALQLSILIKDQNSQMKILYKIGVNYYYTGNSRMGQHYYQLSFKGLQKREREVYERQFDLNMILRHVESQIFKLPQRLNRKHKSLEKDEADLNKENILKCSQKTNKHNKMVIEMFKVKNTVKDAQIMRKTMNKTLSLAQIKQTGALTKKSSIYKEAEIILIQPVQNCTQVLKSHLSKQRAKKNTRVQRNDWRQITQFIRQAYCQRIFSGK